MPPAVRAVQDDLTRDGRQRLLIDTDTASDDAVALLMALRWPSADVLAITVVAGNVPLTQGVQNALYTVELAGADVPVYPGRHQPRRGPLRTAQFVHGTDGMGDIGLNLTGRAPAVGDAVDVLVDAVRGRPAGVTLVTLGPLTNVAAAFERAPELPRLLKRLVVMGGAADAVGNMTAVAEYNVWCDPEAAAVVFASGAPIEMVGWDVSRRYAVFSRADAYSLRRLGPLGTFSVEIQATLDAYARSESGLAGFDLPDPIAMAVALDRSIAIDTRRLHVAVELDGALTRGQTVVDHLGIEGRSPNVDVVVAASRSRFLDVLRRTLTGDEGTLPP